MSRPGQPIAISFFIALCCTLLAPEPVAGQRGSETGTMGFAVSIGSEALSARPGQTAESEITIIAQGTERVTRYQIRPLDLGQGPYGGTRPVPIGEGARSCADWFSVDENVEIPPEGRITVPFSITVPAGAVGEYYAFLEVKHMPVRSDRQVVIMVRPALVVSVVISIPGRRALELRTEGLSYDPFLVNGEPGILLEVMNSGQAKSPVEGDILLYGPKGTFPYRAHIPVTAVGTPYTIYPGISISLKCPLVEVPPPGAYQAQARVLMAGRWTTRSNFDITIPESIYESASASLSSKSELDIDFQVAPDFVEIALPSGAVRTVSVRVLNRDTVTVVTRASVGNVTQEANGFLTFSDFEDPAGQWVTVSPGEIELGPHSSANFLLEVRRPEAASEEFAMCAARFQGVAGTDAEGWRSEVDIGVPVIVVNPGATPPEIEVEKIEVIRRRPEDNPTAALLILRNVGGRVAKISGKLAVERASSRQPIQTLQFGRRGDLLLPPGGVREIRMKMPLLDIGRFLLLVEGQITGQPKSNFGDEVRFECAKGPPE